MIDIEREIQVRTETFIAEIVGLVKKAALESVAEAIDGRSSRSRSAKAPSSRGGRGRASGRGSVVSSRGRGRKKGQKRTPEELEALTESLWKEIKAGPGRRVEQIAEAMGVNTKELVLPARKLWNDGRIRTKGVKRATKYYAK